MNGKECEERRKPKPLILVVDDVPRNLEVVCSILKKEEFKIAAAGDGRRALEMIPELHPDLILMDVMMPEMDGFEVCKKLKGDPETKDIPIIFLTAKTETEDIVKGFEFGAVDYVTKPFNGTELLSRVKTHLELKFSRERLNDLVATRNKFFSIIAHDLRDPLQFLLLSADSLYHNYDSFTEEKKKDYLRRFYHCSNQISSLLENLLQWSMSQRGVIEYKPEKITIGPLVRETIDLLKESAQKKGIAITTGIGDKLCAYADKNMVQTIIRNLISNGVKFTRAGGEVNVNGSRTETNVEITVSDNGVGMDSEHVAGLFRLDEYKNTTGTANEKGTGLGLILCKEFIERHNGAIAVTSEPGKGSCFTIRIPASR